MSKIKNFDKTLTKAEIEAPTYLEWPDETIARCVRATAEEIQDTKGNKAMVIQAAYQLIAGMMSDTNAETLKASMTMDWDGKPLKFKLTAKLAKVKESPNAK